MALTHKQLFVVSCGLAVQAAILVLINGLMPNITHGMDMMWIAFQAWAVYFVVGCTPMNGVKAWIGYLTGILTSIAIIQLTGMPGIKSLPVVGGMNLALSAAVFIMVIPAIMSENFKNMVPALFIGSGAFFASLGHASLADSLKAAGAVGSQSTTFLYAAQAELLYCALGLSFGFITVFWRSRYEASLAAK
ncbi:MAG: hypothetical protein RLZZ282_1181 [Verrucomicrobiota bacterium]